jgi:hypothetical protein
VSTDTSLEPLVTRLERLVTDDSGSVSVDAHATPARLRLSLPDRRIVVTRRRGPDGTDRWSVTLRSDGETVSKFGRFEARDAVVDQVRSLCDVDVRYTVCCDGDG